MKWKLTNTEKQHLGLFRLWLFGSSSLLSSKSNDLSIALVFWQTYDLSLVGISKVNKNLKSSDFFLQRPSPRKSVHLPISSHAPFLLFHLKNLTLLFFSFCVLFPPRARRGGGEWTSTRSSPTGSPSEESKKVTAIPLICDERATSTFYSCWQIFLSFKLFLFKHFLFRPKKVPPTFPRAHVHSADDDDDDVAATRRYRCRQSTTKLRRSYLSRNFFIQQISASQSFLLIEVFRKWNDVWGFVSSLPGPAIGPTGVQRVWRRCWWSIAPWRWRRRGRRSGSGWPAAARDWKRKSQFSQKNDIF